MNNKLKEIKNFSIFHLLNIKYKKNQGSLKNNSEKDYLPIFKMVWNKNNVINTVSEVSRVDWWRRWLYSTNAKDIGMLYIYFAIFSGKSIMPLKNLAIYWNNWYINNVIIIKFNIKSVSIVNKFKLIKYYRDFKQELLFLLLKYLYIINILSLKENYLILKIMFYRYIHNTRELSKNKVLNDQLGPYLAGLIESDGSIIILKENFKNKIHQQYLLFFT